MKHYYMKKVMCLSYGVIRCMHFVVAFRIFITEIVVVNTMVEPKKAKVPVTIRIDPNANPTQARSREARRNC